MANYVVLLDGFVVDSWTRQLGFSMQELLESDLPDDAMYWGYIKERGNQLMFIMPEARSKYAAYRLSTSPDPTWKIDPSYNWVSEGVANA